MKKHFLGIVVFLAVAVIGLFSSPIRFDCRAMGHGAVKDGSGFYWIHGYKSMYFVSLSNQGEGYDSSEKAHKIFESRLKNPDVDEISNQKVLEQTENRAVVYFQTTNDTKGYCVMRVEKTSLESICSTSLWHVLEFEKQNYINKSVSKSESRKIF